MTTRRKFLRGMGGVVLALPFLETFAPRRASAATYPPWAVFMRQANGVVQETDEPEMFWPYQVGALTQTTLAEQTDRALHVLADHADKLLVVRGIDFAFDGNMCGHSGGGNQCLTAAKVSDDPVGNESLAMGESLDNLIATQLHPEGVEPLTLYAGKMSGYINEVMSYRGPKMLRAAERNPFNAYQKLFGLNQLSPEVLEKLKAARASVNDLVRGEMTALMSRTDLSTADRDRLQLHFDAIRDLEVTMSCTLPEMEVAEMEAIQDQVGNSDNLITVAQMQMDIMALALACGAVRTGTLQIGDGNDSTEYTIFGQKQYSYHWISHRIQGDGDVGDPIENAPLLHHEIDKIHGNLFKYLLDKLASYTLGDGTLLDAGVAVWLNDLADKYHSYTGVPYILAGSCGGVLRNGLYVDVGNVNNNKLFNTIGTAVGCKTEGKDVLDDFGDDELEGGVLSELMV